MTSIENEYLKVSIREQGAELTSVINKADGTEHLWQGNPDIWPWHAPNLFPVIGATVNMHINVDGKAYPIGRHGFTRESLFELVDTTNGNHAKYSLMFNESTLASYPYKFEFQIIYDLIDDVLRVRYKVINLDEQPIYFSVGGHPAFNVPFFAGEALEDYYLEFENEEKLETHLLTEPGLFKGTTEVVPTEGRTLPLTKHLFDKDALVFKNLTSREVTIRSKKHNKFLSVKFPHLNYLGIWAKPGAPFVCIEPWLGCADTDGVVTDIKDKEAIQMLEIGHVFEVDFFVTINKNN